VINVVPPKLWSLGQAPAPAPLQKLGGSVVGLYGLALAGYPPRRWAAQPQF